MISSNNQVYTTQYHHTIIDYTGKITQRTITVTKTEADVANEARLQQEQWAENQIDSFQIKIDVLQKNINTIRSQGGISAEALISARETLINSHLKHIDALNNVLKRLRGAPDQTQQKAEPAVENQPVENLAAPQIPEKNLAAPQIPDGLPTEKDELILLDSQSMNDLWHSVAHLPSEDFFYRQLKDLVSKLFDSARQFPQENNTVKVGISSHDLKNLCDHLEDPISLSFMEAPRRLSCGHRISYESLKDMAQACPYKCALTAPAQIDKMLQTVLDQIKPMHALISEQD